MARLDDIETLFRVNYGRMHALASAMLRDREAAHDIVHDVFASILDTTFNGLSSPGYLMTSVRNRCLNRLKAMDVRARFRQLYLVENEEADIEEEWPDAETIALLEKAKKDMPPKCLEVFQMRYRDGLPASEIARVLGTGERMIYKHLRHAVELLKNRLNG